MKQESQNCPAASWFDAQFVIDGMPREDTPRSLLTEEYRPSKEETEPVVVSDETADPHLSAWTYRESGIPSYLEQMRACPYPFSLRYPESAARLALAQALAESLWRPGHFTFEQLRLSLLWKWDAAQLGAMAAFYQTCEALGEYAESLRMDADRLEWEDAAVCELLPRISVSPSPGDAPSAPVSPEAATPSPAFPSQSAVLPSQALPDTDSWLLYLPLDPCGFSLGGSLLSKVCGNPGDGPVETGDGDYLMDVYEIVREMVEDGIVLSGFTVGRGGLMTALSGWCPDGADIDIAPLMRAYDLKETDETDRARVLFGEVPGVLIQIADDDYDYVDAQCLLQDVAYYALGHPAVRASGAPDVAARIHIAHNASPALSTLLQALMGRR